MMELLIAGILAFFLMSLGRRWLRRKHKADWRKVEPEGEAPDHSVAFIQFGKSPIFLASPTTMGDNHIRCDVMMMERESHHYYSEAANGFPCNVKYWSGEEIKDGEVVVKGYRGWLHHERTRIIEEDEWLEVQAYIVRTDGGKEI